MPDEPRYGGKDAIAGTPLKQPLAQNRKVGGLPDVKRPGKARPRRVRRGG